MWQTFVEGVQAVPNPCSRALVIISVLAVAIARYRLFALGGAVIAAIIGCWNLAAAWVVIDQSWNWLAYLVAAVSLVAIVVWRRNQWVATAGAAGAVLAASMWWIPCVGPRFGSMLNDAVRDSVVPVMFPFAIYMLGLMFPAIVVAVVAELVTHRLSARTPEGSSAPTPSPT